MWVHRIDRKSEPLTAANRTETESDGCICCYCILQARGTPSEQRLCSRTLIVGSLYGSTARSLVNWAACGLGSSLAVWDVEMVPWHSFSERTHPRFGYLIEKRRLFFRPDPPTNRALAGTLQLAGISRKSLGIFRDIPVTSS